MKKIFGLGLVVICLLLSGCGELSNINVNEAIPEINIQSLEGIIVEITDAEPKYMTADFAQETLLNINYIIRNKTTMPIKRIDYELVFTGYSSDGELLFEKTTNLLFNKAEKLAPNSYAEGFLPFDIIKGTTKIERLEVVLNKKY